jgi:hypothetical protein
MASAIRIDGKAKAAELSENGEPGVRTKQKTHGGSLRL